MAIIRLKAYGAWLTESRTAVEIPDHKVDQLVKDLQATQRERKRVQ